MLTDVVPVVDVNGDLNGSVVLFISGPRCLHSVPVYTMAPGTE